MGRSLSQTCFSLFIFSLPIILCPSLHLQSLSAHHFIMSHLRPLSPPPLLPPASSRLSLRFTFFSIFSHIASRILQSLFPVPSPFHPSLLLPSLPIHPSSSLAIFPLCPSVCVSASIRGKWKK